MIYSKRPMQYSALQKLSQKRATLKSAGLARPRAKFKYVLMHIKQVTDVSMADAELVIRELSNYIAQRMKSVNAPTTIPSFGTFKTVVHIARNGRNPHTGATIKIPVRRVVTFKPSVKLNRMMNN